MPHNVIAIIQNPGYKELQLNLKQAKRDLDKDAAAWDEDKSSEPKTKAVVKAARIVGETMERFHRYMIAMEEDYLEELAKYGEEQRIEELAKYEREERMRRLYPKAFKGNSQPSL